MVKWRDGGVQWERYRMDEGSRGMVGIWMEGSIEWNGRGREGNE